MTERERLGLILLDAFEQRMGARTEREKAVGELAMYEAAVEVGLALARHEAMKEYIKGMANLGEFDYESEGEHGTT